MRIFVCSILFVLGLAPYLKAATPLEAYAERYPDKHVEVIASYSIGIYPGDLAGLDGLIKYLKEDGIDAEFVAAILETARGVSCEWNASRLYKAYMENTNADVDLVQRLLEEAERFDNKRTRVFVYRAYIQSVHAIPETVNTLVDEVHSFLASHARIIYVAYMRVLYADVETIYKILEKASCFFENDRARVYAAYMMSVYAKAGITKMMLKAAAHFRQDNKIRIYVAYLKSMHLEASMTRRMMEKASKYKGASSMADQCLVYDACLNSSCVSMGCIQVIKTNLENMINEARQTLEDCMVEPYLKLQAFKEAAQQLGDLIREAERIHQRCLEYLPERGVT